MSDNVVVLDEQAEDASADVTAAFKMAMTVLVRMVMRRCTTHAVVTER